MFYEGYNIDSEAVEVNIRVEEIFLSSLRYGRDMLTSELEICIFYKKHLNLKSNNLILRH